MVDVPTIVDRVRERLLELGRECGLPVELDEHDYRSEDDGWLYLVVKPRSSGIRASDYAYIMARVEKELRAEGIENVLLVPVLPDF